jgi:glycosyltransferase involved in cell wall biosynthesis
MKSKESMSISVAMCTYNGSNYLDDQLDSILAQTIEPDEIVVCDDGSTDSTINILNSYRSDYPELFNIHSNEYNIGVTKNFEKAIRRCENDLIALCDQDDVWSENKLEYQLKTLSENNCELVFHNSAITSESLEQIANHWDTISYKHGTVQDISKAFQFLMKRNYIKGSTMMFNESLRGKVLPIPEAWSYDWYIAFIALLTGDIVDIDKKLHKYRRHDSQASSHNTNSTIEMITRGIKSNSQPSYFEQRELQWQALRQIVDELDPDKLNLDQKFVLNRINDRYHFDHNRKVIHNSKIARVKRVKHAYDNYNSGRYQRYGELPEILYLIHDVGVAIFR